MKTATHSYKLGCKKDKEGKGIILFKLSYGFKLFNPTTNKHDAKPFEYTTKQKIHPDYWEGKRPTIEHNRKYGNDISNTLGIIEKVAYKELSYYREQNDSDPTPEQLKTIVDIKLERTIAIAKDNRIVTFLDKKIVERQAIPIGEKGYWSKLTAKQYLVSLEKWKQFETDTKKIYTNENLTLSDCNNYLQNVASHFNYAQATMNKESRQLISVLNMINDEDGFGLSFNFNKKLKISTSKKSTSIHLTIEMLSKIIDTDISNSKMLTHGRNYCIISSLTGLRISDMRNIHKLSIDEVVDNGNVVHLLTTIVKKDKKDTHKEDLITTIPLPTTVVELYRANGNSFPKFPSETNIRKYVKLLLEKLFPKATSVVTVNKYGKAIEKETQPFSEVFSPHDCRATFITLLRTKLDKAVVTEITHPKHLPQDVFDGYDNATPTDKALKLVDNIQPHKFYPFIYH